MTDCHYFKELEKRPSLTIVAKKSSFPTCTEVLRVRESGSVVLVILSRGWLVETCVSPETSHHNRHSVTSVRTWCKWCNIFRTLPSRPTYAVSPFHLMIFQFRCQERNCRRSITGKLQKKREGKEWRVKLQTKAFLHLQTAIPPDTS